MAEKYTNILVLTFHQASTDKDRRLRIPSPREDLTAQEVKAAMDLVAQNELVWSGVSAKGAKIVQTTTQQIDITAE